MAESVMKGAALDAIESCRPHVLVELHNMMERCKHHVRNGEYNKASALLYMLERLGVNTSEFGGIAELMHGQSEGIS